MTVIVVGRILAAKCFKSSKLIFPTVQKVRMNRVACLVQQFS